MIAWTIAVLLIGVLLGAPVWTALAVKEDERRARRELRKLARR